MLRIEKLSMQLPGAFEHRAADIAHLLAANLSGMSLPANKNIDKLIVPAITVNRQATNAEVAGVIANAILAGIGGNR